MAKMSGYDSLVHSIRLQLRARAVETQMDEQDEMGEPEVIGYRDGWQVWHPECIQYTSEDTADSEKVYEGGDEASWECAKCGEPLSEEGE